MAQLPRLAVYIANLPRPHRISPSLLNAGFISSSFCGDNATIGRNFEPAVRLLPLPFLIYAGLEWMSK